MIRNAAPDLWARLLAGRVPGDAESADPFSTPPRLPIASLADLVQEMDFAEHDAAENGAEERTGSPELLSLPHELLLRILYYVCAGQPKAAISRTALFPSSLPSFYPVRLLPLRRVCRAFDRLATDKSLWRTLDFSKERRLERKDILLKLLERLGPAPRFVSLGKGLALQGTASTLGVYKLVDDEIATFLALNCDLRLLDLSHCVNLDKLFTDPRIRLPNLESLILHDARNLSSQFVETLKCSDLRNLKTLDLGGCAGITDISRLPTACPNLHRLNLARTGVDNASFTALRTSLSNSSWSLRILSLESTKLGPAGLADLVAALPDLTELDLRNLDLTSSSLLTHLPNLINLEFVNLRNCRKVDNEDWTVREVKRLIDARRSEVESGGGGKASGKGLRRALLPLGKWLHFAE